MGNRHPYHDHNFQAHAENMFLPNRKRSKNNATAVQSENSTICLHKQNFKRSRLQKGTNCQTNKCLIHSRYIRFHIIIRIQKWGFISLKGRKNRSGASGREKMQVTKRDSKNSDREGNDCPPGINAWSQHSRMHTTHWWLRRDQNIGLDWENSRTLHSPITRGSASTVHSTLQQPNQRVTHGTS
jgi:hypothetical protein